MNKKALSVFALAMINIAAIGSVKNWPTTAVLGFSSLFFFLLATVVFFIPTALVSAELATGWPRIGGVFVWVKEAFGHRIGFLAVWLLWIENVIWYPTMLAFITSAVAYVINPELASHKGFYLTVMLAIYWGATLLNFRGMKTSAHISTIGVIAGMFLPGAIIIGLGIAWFFSGEPLQIEMNWKTLIPNMSNLEQLILFTGVVLSFCGIEMSAIHAKDVVNPQRDYPRAIWISSLIILVMSILGVLSIAVVVPGKEISLAAGAIQAVSLFLQSYHLGALSPLFAILIIIGAIAALSTWIIGPSRGLLAAAQTGDLPPLFRKLNTHTMPVALLIFQACIVSILSLLFVFMPSLNTAYWVLVILVAQIYLLMYLLMFAAAIKLRYKKPSVFRAYRVPGGNVGMWIVSSLGILSSLFALVFSFFPPEQIVVGNTFLYIASLVVALILVCLTPTIILFFRKPSWLKRLPHEEGS